MIDPYECKVNCDICGGEAYATIEDDAARWEKGTIIRHKDPEVCARFLKEKEQDLARREQELIAKENKT